MVIAVEGSLLQQQVWSFADVSRIRETGSPRHRKSVVSIPTSHGVDIGSRSVCVSRLGEVSTSSRLSSQHVGLLNPFELWARRPQANSGLGVAAARPVNAAIGETDGPELKWWEKGSAPNIHDVHSRQEFLDGLSEAEDKLGCSLSSLEVASEGMVNAYGVPIMVVALSAFLISPGPANADTLNPAYGDVGALLEAGVQLIYLGALLVLLGVGSFLVVRQVLIKRELETAAKDLQERVRTGDASSLEYFELGAVMLRKKYFQLANKYLDQAIKKWDGSEQDLAQVYNALGFSYFSDGKVEKAVAQYEKAVQLQPGYVIAWNNLADAYENQKEFSKALKAYEQALQLDPTNKVASARRELVKTKVDRYQGIP